MITGYFSLLLFLCVLGSWYFRQFKLRFLSIVLGVLLVLFFIFNRFHHRSIFFLSPDIFFFGLFCFLCFLLFIGLVIVIKKWFPSLFSYLSLTVKSFSSHYFSIFETTHLFFFNYSKYKKFLIFLDAWFPKSEEKKKLEFLSYLFIFLPLLKIKRITACSTAAM